MHQERSIIALSGAQDIEGMYIDENDHGFSFRGYKDLLLFGGSSHRTGKNKEGRCYKNLAEAAKILPESKVEFYWSAQDCMTLDDVPYIGLYSLHPQMYVSTGYKMGDDNLDGWRDDHIRYDRRRKKRK